MRLVLTLLLTTLLSSCGTPQFIRSETGKFVTSGEQFVAASRSFYQSVVQSDSAFYATVVATSPACPVPDLLADKAAAQFPPLKLYGLRGIAELYAAASRDLTTEPACADYRASLSALRDTTLKQPESWVVLESRYRNQLAPLCMAAPEQACLAKLPAGQQRLGALTVQPLPLDGDDFRAETETLDAISEYLQALDALAADPHSHVEGHLKTAIGKLEALQDYAGAKWISADVKSKATKAAGLIDLLRELAMSAKQAKQIEKMLDEKSAGIAATLNELADMSDRTYQTNYLFSTDLRITRLKNYLEMSVTGQTMSDRQLAMTQYQKDAAIRRAAEKLARTEDGVTVYDSPTGKALRGAVAAQAKLIEAIKAPTPAQRAEAAALGLANFRAVLKSLYGFLGALGVV